MTRVANITSELLLRLVVPGGPSLPLMADLRYTSQDPWTVRVSFQTGGHGSDGVEWMFGRQLLTDGLSRASGHGDVRVWPGLNGRDRVVNLAMASPSGSALFEIDRDELVEFVQKTYLAVPTGAELEAVDLDAEIARLLA